MCRILRTYDDPADPGMSLATYLRLVDATGRAMRGDKRGAIPADLVTILQRLDLDPAGWLATVARPQGLRGSALGHLAVLATEATRRGLAWLQVRCAVFGRLPAPAPS